jgi:hypothetical protein
MKNQVISHPGSPAKKDQESIAVSKELVEAVADKVYRLLRQEIQIERERCRILRKVSVFDRGA